ncbi:MAG: transferase, partial [Burkholderiales bacterium]
MDNVIVIGSSGQAKVVIDVVRREGRRNIVGLLDRFR